jgi:RimJ/RimL family protein N-acetyltransferase
MILHLKEKEAIDINDRRNTWLKDPSVNEYVEIRDAGISDDSESSLTNFNRYYEIYNNDVHVGDIKLFYETEDDIFNKRAQILMVVGERSQGIGTEALRLLIKKIEKTYNSIYSIIQRTNVPSLKILKKNAFEIDAMDDYTITLVREL